jgi:MFS family permease
MTRFRLRGNTWRQPDFLRFWFGESVSQLGSQVTLLALPTVAILGLGAGAFQVGILRALQNLAFLLLALVIGVWVDRVRRRRVLVLSDIGQVVVLGSIPLAVVLHQLTLERLYVVALLSGIFAVANNVTFDAYLPALVTRNDLVEANSRIQVTNATTDVAGPPLAGLLIQTLGPALAIAADVLSYLFSAVALLSIRTIETVRPNADGVRPSFNSELVEGLRVTLRNPILASLAGCSMTANLAGAMLQTVGLIYFYRDLGLSPGVVGLVFGISGAGGILGAFAAPGTLRRFGVGRALATLVIIEGLAIMAMPAARLGAAAIVVGACAFVIAALEPTYAVAVGSIRQAVTPDHLRGRVTGTIRTISFGIMPIGSVIGGILGTKIGIIPTLFAAGVLWGGSAVWILLGPVIRLRETPGPSYGSRS